MLPGLQKIEFVKAQKMPHLLTTNRIQNKYILLNPSDKSLKASAVPVYQTKKSMINSHAKDGIPLPKYVIFAMENLNLTWSAPMKVGAGLINLGNTCFINSALQCLTYTPPLANYLLIDNHKKYCKIDGQFCMLCALQRHLHSVFNCDSQSTNPTNILKNLKHIAKHMLFGHQEDAHEFIRYSIDVMQKSCLFGLPSKLDMHTKATTLVHRVFGGYLRSRVKCRQCKAVSDTYEPFLDVSVDINKPDCLELKRCLEYFVFPEVLQGDNLYKCHRCKSTVAAYKTFSFHRSPNILTIQLKRFSSFMGHKINKDISYPSKLNIGPFMSNPPEDGLWYELYAVLVHSGLGCQSGHYYAFAKAFDGQWYCFNDSSVRQVSASHVLSQQAYILFYHYAHGSRCNMSLSSTVQTMPDVSHQPFNREPILQVLDNEIKINDMRNNNLTVTSIMPRGFASAKSSQMKSSVLRDEETKKNLSFISTFLSSVSNNPVSKNEKSAINSKSVSNQNHSNMNQPTNDQFWNNGKTGSAVERGHLSVKKSPVSGTKPETTSIYNIKKRTVYYPLSQTSGSLHIDEQRPPPHDWYEAKMRGRHYNLDIDGSPKSHFRSEGKPTSCQRNKTSPNLTTQQIDWNGLSNISSKGDKCSPFNGVTDGKSKKAADCQLTVSKYSQMVKPESNSFVSSRKHKLTVRYEAKKNKRSRQGSVSSNCDILIKSDEIEPPSSVEEWTDQYLNKTKENYGMEDISKERSCILSQLLQQSSSKVYSRKMPSSNNREAFDSNDYERDYQYGTGYHTEKDDFDKEYHREDSKKNKINYSEKKLNNKPSLFEAYLKYHSSHVTSSY